MFAVDPLDLHVAAGRPGRVTHRLGYREIRVRQLDVLADEANRQRNPRAADPLGERDPLREVGRVRAGEAELLDDDPAEAGFLEHQRDAVDGPRVGFADHVFCLHVAEERDLLAEIVVDRLVGPRDHHIGLDTDRAELADGVLSRLRLELAGGDPWEQREVDVEDVLLADVVPELTDRLEVGERFDIAHRTADLDDHELGLLLARDAMDPLLDLVRHVRDDLDGRAEVIAAALLRDDRVVDLTGRQVRCASDVAVYKTLVVAEVEVGLGTVFSHEYLAVLVGRHRPRIDVEIGIHLERCDGESSRGEDATEGSGSDAFAERGSDPSGHEHELRHGLDLRGFSNSIEVALVSPAWTDIAGASADRSSEAARTNRMRRGAMVRL